jgi:hypothetical protein
MQTQAGTAHHQGLAKGKRREPEGVPAMTRTVRMALITRHKAVPLTPPAHDGMLNPPHS